MHERSRDADSAMLPPERPEWPVMSDVMGPVCRVRERAGDVEEEDEGVKERREVIGQTCTFESAEPDSAKLRPGSIARAVTACRCDAGVVT
jgi:hypothetical protein